jgi:hypothetical protein
LGYKSKSNIQSIIKAKITALEASELLEAVLKNIDISAFTLYKLAKL